MSARKLSPKQEVFVQEYLKDLNATQAAIRAGYSEKSASRIGIELLNKNHVREAVEKGRAKRAEKVERTMGVSPSWGKFRGQKSFFRWCTTIFPWGIFAVSAGRFPRQKQFSHFWHI